MSLTLDPDPGARHREAVRIAGKNLQNGLSFVRLKYKQDNI